MKKIHIESEFAPLRSVVLTQSQFCLSDKSGEADTTFLAEENTHLAQDNEGRDLADFVSEQQVYWEKEKEVMQGVLESYGVEVFHPRLLTTYEKEHGKELSIGYSSFFPRDPFFTTGNLLIEGNLRFQHRRQETLPIRPVTQQWTQETEGYYFAAPQPNIPGGALSEAGPFIEGGDVLVLGKTIFVGYSGLVSSLAGIQWLVDTIGHFGYEVVPVRLHPHILHLDCTLSLLREDLMIVCKEAFLDGLPTQLANWEKIRVTLQEVAYLVINGLPLNEETYITDRSFTALIPQTGAKGIKVETISYHVLGMSGGSLRCTTQTLIREQSVSGYQFP